MSKSLNITANKCSKMNEKQDMELLLLDLTNYFYSFSSLIAADEDRYVTKGKLN